MKNTNVAEDETKDTYFIMQEYTEILRGYLRERRNIAKIVFKIVGRIYRATQNGATEKEIKLYIDMLKKNKYD